MVENFNLSCNLTRGMFGKRESYEIYQILIYGSLGRIIFIQNIDNMFISLGSDGYVL